VVLAIFGGTGVALYLLAWLLIPKREPDGTLRPSWVSRHGHGLGTKTLAVLAVLGLILLASIDDGSGAAAVAVLAVIAYLVYRDRQGAPVLPQYSTAAESAAHGSPGAPPPQPVAWVSPPPYVRVRRERSRLGLITFSVAAVVTGVLVWAGLAGADGITAGRVTAAALLVVGAGLVVGTWYGRGRWLISLGVLLCLGLGATIAADATGATLRGGVGERTWVVGEGMRDPRFTLGIGEATLDLTALPADGPHVVVRGELGLGHLVILVPDDVPIRLHAKLRIGDLTEFGDSLASGGDRIERTRTYGPPGDPRIEVEATLGTGQIEVRHG
jgi:hypothetical protein